MTDIVADCGDQNHTESVKVAPGVGKDALTGLLNRQSFCKLAEKMIADKHARYYTLSCFDVDNFTVINDQYGNETGDRVLKNMAQIIHRNIHRFGGLACREFTDTFAILFPTEVGAKIAALRGELEEAFLREGIRAPMQISAGRYAVSDHDHPVSALLDLALLAKRSAKGRYDTHTVYYNEEMHATILTQQWVTGEMERALEERQFEVWFQPQYDHSTGAMIGAEALARWRHPEKGLIMPDTFAPIFERNGFIYEMDKYIWNETCRMLKTRIEMGQRVLPVSVNASRYDVYQPDFAIALLSAIERNQIPRRLLRVEITESAFATNTEQIASMMNNLRRHGIIVEIDDFGSGYSSFNALKDVTADVLKIDMRFLQGKTSSERSGNILESIVRMAKWLNMAVIAEGVETGEQANFLRSIGCPNIQGYFYARPMPAQEYEALLETAPTRRSYVGMETLNSMNPDSFWNPDSIETMVFNHYAGGACVFEYRSGEMELLRINEKFCAVLNTKMTEAELLSSDFKKLLDYDSRNRLRTAIDFALESRSEEKCTLKYIDQGGERTEQYLRLTIRMIARMDDRYLFYGYVENITRQTAAEKRARRTNERLSFFNAVSGRFLTDNNPEEAIRGVLVRTMHYFGSRRVYVFEADQEKESYQNTYEVCDREVRPRIKWQKAVPAECLADCIAILKDRQVYSFGAADSEKCSPAGAVLLGEDASTLVAVPLFHDAALVGLLGVNDPTQNVDSTEHLMMLGNYISAMIDRRNERRQLRFDRAAIAAIMQGMPVGFVRIQVKPNGEARIVSINDFLCQMLGTDQKRILQYCATDAYAGIHPADRLRVQQLAERCCRSGSPFSVDFRLRAADGQYAQTHMDGNSVANDWGEVTLNLFFMDAVRIRRKTEAYWSAWEELPCGAAVFQYGNGQLNALYVNARLKDAMGRSEQEIFNKDALQTIHPADRAGLIRELERCIKSGQRISYPMRLLSGAGEAIPYQAIGRCAGEKTQRTLIYALFRPLSEKARSTAEIETQKRLEEQQAREAVERLNTMLHTEQERNRYYAELLLGVSEGENVSIIKGDLTAGKTTRMLYTDGAFQMRELQGGWENMRSYILSDIHPSDRALVEQNSQAEVLLNEPDGTRMEFTYRSRSAMGAYRWYTSTLRVYDDAENHRCVTIFTKDINDDMEERARLLDMAERDGLTDLYNRAKLESMACGEYSRLASVGVLFFDLNGLKACNDQYGHEMGDHFLRTMADSIRSITSRTIHAYRYGGDEFLVVLCNCTRKEVEVQLNLWRARLKIVRESGGLEVDAAVGQIWSQAPFDLMDLIYQADRAMYADKKLHRKK